MDSIDVAEPRQGRQPWLIGLLVVGGLLLVFLLCAGSFGALAVFGWNVFEDDAREALEANPVVAEHIGKIEDMDLSLSGMANAEGGDDVFVFELEGSKGDGTVIATFVTEGNAEVVTQGTLELRDGIILDLVEPKGGEKRRKKRRRR